MTSRRRRTVLAATELVATLEVSPAFSLPLGFGTESVMDPIASAARPNAAGALHFEGVDALVLGNAPRLISTATDGAANATPAAFDLADEAVPEPSTLLLVGGTLIGLAILARRP